MSQPRLLVVDAPGAAGTVLDDISSDARLAGVFRDDAGRVRPRAAVAAADRSMNEAGDVAAGSTTSAAAARLRAAGGRTVSTRLE